MSFATFEQDVAALALAAVTAADPAALVSSQIAVSPGAVMVAGESYAPARILVVSVGKAAVAMAAAAAVILADTLTGGVVISKTTAVPDLPPPLRYFPGSHPLPSQLSLQATQAVYDLLADTQPDDLVLCLISGGASALLTRPVLPLAQWQALNDALLRSGCAINDVNTIRQQFDTVKGGGLAQWAAPRDLRQPSFSAMDRQPAGAYRQRPHRARTAGPAASAGDFGCLPGVGAAG
ncbi:DUF4147 domain-containing protein [Candidatus Amarobacter glycogenicus]|uniref:DUF4147 domain-containing protein n=1 Tax=Candidatus Amarobacter glycogenicus TaxID=3140699 RepID=UPI002A147006|nr:DUF4147 domain-containing protein [Dehalococcoidia bacterium]